MAGELMLDIETLSVKPNAVMLSVAAVSFVMDAAFYSVLQSRDGGFYASFSFQRMIDAGGHVSEETLRWWLGEGGDAIHLALGSGGRDTHSVLRELAQFIHGAAPDRVWSQGSMDITVLEHWFTRFGVEIPWRYSAVRDARTYLDAAGIGKGHIPEGYNLDNHVAHNPIHDCLFQIANVQEAFRRINRKAS